MTPDLLPLLESPERLIRRLAGELGLIDAGPDLRTRIGGALTDRGRWHRWNYARRRRGLENLSFEEYLVQGKGKLGNPKGRPKGSKNRPKEPGKQRPSQSPEEKAQHRRWYSYNSRLRYVGLPEITYEEWQALPPPNQRATKETHDEKEARYQRLKERLKTELSSTESRASMLGILTPEDMRLNTMEDRSTTVHYWDKMIRQEGGSPIAPRAGWSAIGNGGFWKYGRNRSG